MLTELSVSSQESKFQRKNNQLREIYKLLFRSYVQSYEIYSTWS